MPRDVSIVIPTHQRRDVLRRALESLRIQTASSDSYEVIVAVDRSTDGTWEMVKSLATPYALRAVTASAPGRGAACNAGIAAAAGSVLVLLDDDMEVEPAFVSSHLRNHPPGSRICVLGPVPVRDDATRNGAASHVRTKFDDHLRRLAEPGHQFSVRDFYSGNASLRLDVMREVGGFDESFTVYGNEDVELAMRLRAAGVTLKFDPDATAVQTYDKGLLQLLRDTRAKGATTVRLARMHPEAFDSLRLANPDESSMPWLTARPLLLRLTRAVPFGVRAAFGLGLLLARTGLGRQPLFYRALLDYAFWAGVDAELGRPDDASDLGQLATRLRRTPVGTGVQRVAGGLDERIALSAPARRLRFRLTSDVIARYAESPVGRILDAGCGDGLLAVGLAQRHPEWTVVGVDLRDGLLALARARAQARGVANATFVQADLTETLPVAGLDVVLAVECLSEIPDDEAVLKNLTDVLRPGGLAVIHVPERSWRAVLPGSPSTWREQTRQGYGADELRDLLTAAGLEVLEIRPTYRALAAAAQEVRDRIKGWHVLARAAVFPLLAAAAWLEHRGLRLGEPRALIAAARRPVVS